MQSITENLATQSVRYYRRTFAIFCGLYSSQTSLLTLGAHAPEGYGTTLFCNLARISVKRHALYEHARACSWPVCFVLSGVMLQGGK